MKKSFQWKAKNGINAEDRFQKEISDWLKSTGHSMFLVPIRKTIITKCNQGHEHSRPQNAHEFLRLQKVWEHIPIPLHEHTVTIEIGDTDSYVPTIKTTITK